MGVIGFFLGWQKVILIVLIASLLGSIIELILIGMKKKERGEEFAFGPYLVFGSLIAMLYGDIIINFYLKLFNIG
jgi:prepilin signal peptidase PulO-like enzyme (type II secretory pathway)